MPSPDFSSLDHPVPNDTAFFLDFDGTLAPIVSNPEEAAVPSRTLLLLEKLQQASGGALAIISGRSIAQLDHLLMPLRFPVAGVHGLERRDIHGEIRRVAIDTEAEQRLGAAVSAFAGKTPGLLAEVKPGSVALHYRGRPEMEEDCLRFAKALAREDNRIHLVCGKKVIEMKLSDRDKASALAAFMAEPPFRGRRPFFAGDDVTDENGFDFVNAQGGLSLKIGAGETRARHRLADPAALAVWLERLLEK